MYNDLHKRINISIHIINNTYLYYYKEKRVKIKYYNILEINNEKLDKSYSLFQILNIKVIYNNSIFSKAKN